MDLAQRQKRASLLTGREVRRVGTVEMESREANDGMLHFRGLASRTGNAYDMGWYSETVQPEAFRKTLSENPDVQLLANHEGLPIARTTNGSLDLAEVSEGLHFHGRAEADDPHAIMLHRKVQSGLMDQCSFAFRTIREQWNEDYDQRTMVELSLHRGDVSIVNYGANPETPVTARSAEAMAALAGMSVRELADFFLELRSGAALSTTATAVLKHILSLASTADNAVDELQVVLSDFLGVPNPDKDAPSAGSQQQKAAVDLDTYRARAFALGVRGVK